MPVREAKGAVLTETEAYRRLIAIADSLKPSYCDVSAAWKGSAFQWIKGGIASRRKGKAGEEMVRKFLEGYGFSVERSPDSDADLVVDGKRVEVKLSTLWGSGIYKFQQIRNQNYDLIFCLGLSPHKAHAWIVRKSEIAWEELSPQHGGKEGNDTWWISFAPPDCPHAWMLPQDGDLSLVCDHLREAISG